MNPLIYNEFKKNGGILKTSDLKKLGLYSRNINILIKKGDIAKIKHGYYALSNLTYPEEVVIARIFPDAVIFLESALLIYGYTDRIPSAWQIAVNKDSEKSKYNLSYPLIDVFYVEPKILSIGVEVIQTNGVNIKVFNRDRTICDVLRYENKLEREVFKNAIQRYVKDTNKNVKRLIEYAEIFNITRKVQTYIGVWL